MSAEVNSQPDMLCKSHPYSHRRLIIPEVSSDTAAWDYSDATPALLAQSTPFLLQQERPQKAFPPPTLDHSNPNKTTELEEIAVSQPVPDMEGIVGAVLSSESHMCHKFTLGC